ncbi:arylsulfatase B-like isoform X2 [Paramacrobiotus metropolitanus]|uniref:arylsulfatase B-like isoform X2 n=1 Tax=Paramacrobiotus metropolitanus TaxID=2943436 RepID=UPI002445E342|nr:arylsulfatase B-like isoform X2 [Paramacrobiotus metropolitanus]
MARISAALGHLFVLTTYKFTHATPPNIVLIVADDLGWNDVSYHGYTQIPTPHIDHLAATGMILHSHYSQASCSPSRTALLTGKYPMRFGLQSGNLAVGERRGIPLTEKLMPQYFKELGYSTHMIGKWHVGYAAPEMTPTFRGFDSFFGYYSGFIDYFTHRAYTSNNKFGNGFDLWDNLTEARNYAGQYLTDIFTEKTVQRIMEHDFNTPLFLYIAHMAPHWATEKDPVQSPEAYTNRFPHITHEGRKKYAGTIAALDDSVGKILTALQNRKVDDNTIVIFVSDNGGCGPEGVLHNSPAVTYGSNWPLRGAKSTWFEGGVRTVGIVWSRLLQHPGTVWNGLMHLTDWLPTLMTAVGGMPVRNVDGVDQWKALVDDAPSMRTELLVQADALRDEYAIRWYQYKLILKERAAAQNGAYEWFEPEDGLNTSYINADLPAVVRCDPPEPSNIDCNRHTAPCLFDLERDPCERNNIAKHYPDVVKLMLDKLHKYNATGVHPLPPPQDPLGLPALLGDVIRPWLTVSDLNGAPNGLISTPKPAHMILRFA